MDGDDGIIGEDSEEEWKKTQNVLQKVGAKLHSGNPLTAEEIKEIGI